MVARECAAVPGDKCQPYPVKDRRDKSKNSDSRSASFWQGMFQKRVNASVMGFGKAMLDPLNIHIELVVSPLR